MDTRTLACTDIADAARLLIHADAQRPPPAGAGWRVEALLQRLRARVRDAARPRLALEIHDLQGHRVLALPEAPALVDVALPPGTYQVTARAGTRRRGYTVALEPGASFDLHLHLHLRFSP